MKFTPYLSFNGQCEEAFKFYESCFHGTIAFMMKYGDSPMAAQTPEELKNRVMHVTLHVGPLMLQGADAPPQFFSKPQGFSISVELDDVAEAERIYAELSKGGDVKMALQQTFWALRFAMVIDRFGQPWMINCNVSPSAS